MRKGGAHQVAREQTRPRMDWRQALDESDAALVSCAAQVVRCIEREAAQ